VSAEKKVSTAFSRARGRREVEHEARMSAQPAQHLGMLVGGVVIQDHVDHLAGGDLTLDGVEEADEFLVPVALHAVADHGVVQDVEGGEQGRGAVAFVVEGQRARLALLHRQARLGPIERLDLALFVHGQHDRMGRRIDLQTDDVLELGGELGILGQFEALDPVRLQAVRRPDPLDRA
jgi:hypothetical protein